jgi:hypothetical protein
MGAGAALAGLILWASLWLSSGTAVSADAPERTPVAGTQTVEAGGASHAVAAIALHAPAAPATAWTVVQWGDPLGGWHDVEGWRGDLDEGQQKVWWVLSKDYDTGPFRWVVYAKRGGQIWSISPAFTLPSRDGQWLRVDVVP